MIIEILREGERNAMPARDICAILNITSRDLSKQIERERRAGYPICASTGKTPGYYRAENKQEMQSYCGRLYHRAGEIFKTRRACLQTIDTLPGELPAEAATVEA